MNSKQISAAILASAFLTGALRADNPTQEAAIVSLAQSHPQQGRTQLIVDAKLSQAAQARADDMLARGYFDHTNPDGLGPNWIVQNQFGFALPSWYDQTAAGNNIESIATETGYGPSNAQRTFNDWLNSPGHRRHLLAETSFYAEQTRVGVGIASDGNTNISVFLSAPCTPNPTDTWSANRAQAANIYTYFAGQGDTNTGLAYWFYFSALADRDFYNAYCYEQYALLKYWQGLAYYYYTLYTASGNRGYLYNYFLYTGYAYYFYYTALGNPSSAGPIFSYYANLANSVL